MTLHVDDLNGKRVEVMHGQRCIGVLVHDSDGATIAGVVLDPDGARELAALLEQQAASSEQP